MENIKTSKDEEWAWIKSEPTFIHDFIWNGEILGAVIQRTKKLGSQYSLINAKLLESEGTTLLHKLSHHPLNKDQMEIFDGFTNGGWNQSKFQKC